MTFSDLKAEVYRRLEESSASPAFFSDDDIGDAVNEGYLELSDASEWYEVWRTVDLCHTRPYYDLRTIVDVEVLVPGRAFNEQTNRWLTPKAPTDLDPMRRRWETLTGQPDTLLTRGLWWVRYYPMVASESGTIKQYATALPAEMRATTDEPGFPEVYHRGCVEYALAILLPQQGEASLAVEAWAAYLAYESGVTAWAQGRGEVPQEHGYGGV